MNLDCLFWSWDSFPSVSPLLSAIGVFGRKDLEGAKDHDLVCIIFMLRLQWMFLFLQLEKCAQDLGSTSKAVGSSMAQLLTCAAQGNEHYTGETHTLHDAIWAEGGVH